MENYEKAKHIVDIIRRYTEDAVARYIRAEADMARAEAGSELWEKEHKDEVGCFSRDPYNVEMARNLVDSTQKEKLTREEILAYTINVFLDKIFRPESGNEVKM